jgi:hypothetical protein
MATAGPVRRGGSGSPPVFHNITFSKEEDYSLPMFVSPQTFFSSVALREVFFL